jgi:hypothetical protein
METKFPMLHCRCPNNHVWASLIPKDWFFIKDMECPRCGEPAHAMKAGDWKDIEEIKKAQEK